MATIVKSVEYVEIDVLSTELDVSSSLTKGQDYRNCVPFMTSHSTNDYLDSKLFDMYFSGTFINGIINFSRGNLRVSTATIKCYVVEFYPSQVKVQQGTFDNSSATTDTVTLPISLNSKDKAAVVFSWKTTSSSQQYRALVVRGRVLDETSMDFYRNYVDGSCTGHWFLFEDLVNNFKVTHKDSSYTSAGQTLTIDDGRCVDPLRTFLLGSYASAGVNTGYLTRGTTRIFLYSNGAIRSDKQDVSYYTIYWNCQVIEFLDQEKIYVPFDHFLTSFTTATQTRAVGDQPNNVPFICDMDYSMVISSMPQGMCRANQTVVAAMKEAFVSVELVDGASIEYTKGAAVYANYPAYVTAVDWMGITVDIGTNDSPIPEGGEPGESFVKSVENFRFTLDDYFGARVLSKGQNWLNCAIFSSTRGTGGDNINQNMANVYIVSPGIVCFKAWDTTAQIIDVSVVEFWPDQVKVQHQNSYLKTTTTTTTEIEELSDINKCLITSATFVAGASADGRQNMVRTGFLDNTTVEFYRYTSTYATDVSFFIVEDLQDNFDSVHFKGDFTSANQNIYDDTHNWDYSNTFIITSYASANVSTTPSRSFISAYYAGEFKPTYLVKYDASYYTVYYYTTVVKFNQKSKHVQHFSATFNVASLTGEYSVDFANHSNALTCYNTGQQSSMKCDTTAATGISDSFATIRITDYDNRTYEQSKPSHTYTSHGSFIMIDWIGQHYQKEYDVAKMTPTKSVINSVQIASSDNTDGYLIIPLTKGQNIKQCVPFISSSTASSDNEPVRFYRSVYRYEDPDTFSVRFGSDATSTRKTTCYITEFSEDIKIQYGAGYADGYTKIFTINEVNLDRAFLVFYGYSDSWENFIRNHAICGHFKSSTELEFIRTYTGEQMCVGWYVVECPDDDSYWKVQHIYETSLGGQGTQVVDIPNHYNINNTLFFASWTSTAAGAYPSRSMYRMRPTLQSIEFNKYDVSYYNMDNVNVEVIQISKELVARGFKASGNDVSLNTTTTSTDIDLRGNNFDLTRSMVISGNQGNEGRVDTTAAAAFDEGYHHYSFKDSNTVTAIKTGGVSYNTYSYFFVYQWPEFNKYYMEGTVIEDIDAQEIPIDREVLAYRSSTGELVDKTTSSGGYFFVETPYPDKHHIVCRDDEAGNDYNDLIYGSMQPAVISGTFAYNEGLVTISGMYIGVPLGRL